MMDYQTIATALDKRAATEIERWEDYKRKHPRKSKGKAKPTFFLSLANQLGNWLSDDNSPLRSKHPTPFSEKQARYVDKACPGAYAFIMDQQRASGQWMNHHPKCPVRLGLNREMGLTVDAEGIVSCEGCNAELGRFRVEVEPEPVPVNLDDLELPETNNLDDFETVDVL